MRRQIILLILVVFFYSVSMAFGNEMKLRVWETAHSKIVEINPNEIRVIHGGKQTRYQFDFSIYDILPNPSRPVILVVTYDPSDMKEDESHGAMPLAYMDCKTFIIDIPAGKKYAYEDSCTAAVTSIWSPNGKYAVNGLGFYVVETDHLIPRLQGGDGPEIRITGSNHGCGGVVDADSWRWVANDLLLFSGGACGTFLDYLFDLRTKTMETYCAGHQKPGYGCPEHSFKPASALEKRIKSRFDCSGEFQ